jgi:putative transposase
MAKHLTRIPVAAPGLDPGARTSRPFWSRARRPKALVSVIQEARIGGVSTRQVDNLVQAMGLTGISKSQVSKLCKDIDERVNAFLGRPIEGEWPCLWLEAT